MDDKNVFAVSGTLGSCINNILRSEKVDKGYEDINELVGDNRRCVEFMNAKLHDDCFQVEDEKSDIYELSQKRAAHSVLTYFLGVLLKPFGRIFDKIKSGDELWIKTSIYHDYGYFSRYVLRSDVNLKNITNNRYLLTSDHPYIRIFDFSNPHLEELAYSYLQLEQYFEYSRVYHFKNGSKEKVDHGILGGALIFSRLTAKLIKNYYNIDEFWKLKKLCLAIAQHNIFRMKEDIIQNYKNSMKYERIEGYENCLDDIFEEDIKKINSVKLDDKTPLLLFLSLVDTIECFKKFGKRENKDHSFNTATVLDNISFSLKEDEIKLDFSELSRYARQKESTAIWFEDTFKKYKNNIAGFEDWTIFKGSCDGYNLSIKLDHIL